MTVWGGTVNKHGGEAVIQLTPPAQSPPHSQLCLVQRPVKPTQAVGPNVSFPMGADVGDSTPNVGGDQ